VVRQKAENQKKLEEQKVENQKKLEKENPYVENKHPIKNQIRYVLIFYI
jgi:hypothetical protein